MINISRTSEMMYSSCLIACHFKHVLNKIGNPYYNFMAFYVLNTQNQIIFCIIYQKKSIPVTFTLTFVCFVSLLTLLSPL